MSKQLIKNNMVESQKYAEPKKLDTEDCGGQSLGVNATLYVTF